MSTHPSYQHTETYVAERYREDGQWHEVLRFPSSADARAYVRANSPAFSPWRIVRLRSTIRSEVLDSQPTEEATP